MGILSVAEYIPFLPTHHMLALWIHWAKSDMITGQILFKT